MIPLEEVRLLPPLDPPTVRDFVAFEEHVEGVVAWVAEGAGVVAQWYQAPAFYFTNPHALVGAYEEVPFPPGCELFDYELEVAAVVGCDADSPAPENVEFFGYTARGRTDVTADPHPGFPRPPEPRSRSIR